MGKKTHTKEESDSEEVEQIEKVKKDKKDKKDKKVKKDKKDKKDKKASKEAESDAEISEQEAEPEVKAPPRSLQVFVSGIPYEANEA